MRTARGFALKSHAMTEFFVLSTKKPPPSQGAVLDHDLSAEVSSIPVWDQAIAA